jgi:hypothetical protein
MADMGGRAKFVVSFDRIAEELGIASDLPLTFMEVDNDLRQVSIHVGTAYRDDPIGTEAIRMELPD